MVKCPNCDHLFPLYSVICHKWIAITQIEKIKNLLKKQKRKELYNNILTCFSNKDNEFSTEEVLNFLDLKKVTDGDVIRTICDALVCQGILKKTKFKKGRGGHRWKKLEMKDRCPYFLTNNNCVCKDWKKIEEWEEKKEENEKES